MTADLIVFSILALATIATALGMLFSRSAVYSALFLVLNFGTVAIFYILLNAPFIAMSQISVYAGAVMVLFLFVIMLLGTDALPDSKAMPWQRPLAFILALMLAGESVYLLFIRKAASGEIPQPVETFGSPVDIGMELFRQYLLPFEVTSILLLVAMVGAIVLTLKEKK